MNYQLRTKNVSLEITGTCGMLTASFEGINPFGSAPWAPQDCGDDVPALLKYLRGDFDCWFGGNGTPVDGKQHFPHGDTCNLEWSKARMEESAQGAFLQLRLGTKTLPGNVVKKVLLKAGQPVIYTQTLNHVDARLSVGHHAIVRIPESADYHINTAPFVYGSTFPEEFLDAGAKPRLAVDKEFQSLTAIPAKDGGSIDISDYYKKKGCDDLMMISSDPSSGLAWSAVTNREENYVFFTIKDPGTLASTMFWFSHFGRDAAPWGLNGKPRHGFSLGMEDVTALFALGIAESLGKVERYRPLCDRLHKAGVKTFLDFNQDDPMPINYIMSAVRVPEGFMGVSNIRTVAGGVELVEPGGSNAVFVPVYTDWLKAGAEADLSFFEK